MVKKVTVEVETEKPRSVEIYLKEVLNTMSKNTFFSIKRFSVEASDENLK